MHVMMAIYNTHSLETLLQCEAGPSLYKNYSAILWRKTLPPQSTQTIDGMYSQVSLILSLSLPVHTHSEGLACTIICKRQIQSDCLFPTYTRSTFHQLQTTLCCKCVPPLSPSKLAPCSFNALFLQSSAALLQQWNLQNSPPPLSVFLQYSWQAHPLSHNHRCYQMHLVRNSYSIHSFNGISCASLKSGGRKHSRACAVLYAYKWSHSPLNL